MLIQWIERLRCGTHEWECLAAIKLYDPLYDPYLSTDQPVGLYWLYRCKKCGAKNRIES